MRTVRLLICLLGLAAVAAAQQKPATPAATPAPAAPEKLSVTVSEANPLSAWNRHAYGIIQDILLRSAEKMPEENYAFRPTEAVRSYGQIVGHLADSSYFFCTTALGQPYTSRNIEKTRTSKAELIAALKEAVAFCNQVYGGMTDAAGTQTVTLFGNANTPKLAVLNVNEIHSMEHYGNLVTYLRMKNIVPPSSEPAPQPPPAKK